VAAPPRKKGKLNEMPCHHKLEQHLDAYITAAGIEGDRKGPLFRSAIGKTAQLTDRPMLRGDVWSMVRRRASRAGIETAIGCHTFRLKVRTRAGFSEGIVAQARGHREGQ